jgi:ABC-2 type transport system ATP-binding protein
VARSLGRGVLLELDERLDAQRVLDAARAAGPVTHFSLERPTLAELFREAVAA